jgi:Fe-S-cluster containining protein
MDLQNFRRRAARNKDGLIGFLKKLDDVVPEEMPALVAKTDAEVWAHVDCLGCANCCKTMTPTFRRPDILRISKHLGMRPKDFVAKWLHQDPENGDWVNNNVPCQFLGADNKCSIYEVRPLDCAEFPHHNKKPFDDYNDTFIGNVPRCPATYELVSRLKKAVERDYEWDQE